MELVGGMVGLASGIEWCRLCCITGIAMGLAAWEELSTQSNGAVGPHGTNGPRFWTGMPQLPTSDDALCMLLLLAACLRRLKQQRLDQRDALKLISPLVLVVERLHDADVLRERVNASGASA